MLILFFVLFVAAMVWLGMVISLFESMAKNHPSMFESLGSPRLFEPKTTDALLRFLYSRRPESLSDSSLLLQANVMRALLPCYLLGFGVIVYWASQSGAGPN